MISTFVFAHAKHRFSHKQLHHYENGVDPIAQCISGQSANLKRQLTVHPKSFATCKHLVARNVLKHVQFILNLLFYMRFSTSGGGGGGGGGRELDILHLQHCQFDISRPKLCIKIRFYGFITSFAIFFAVRHGQSGLKRPELWYYFQ